MRISILAFPFAALLLASCWHPAYDPDLVASAQFADRLGKPVDVFSLSIQGDSSGSGYYLPPRDPASYRLGFGIGREEGSVGVLGVMIAPDGSLYAPSWGYGAYDRFGRSAYFVPTAGDPSSLVVWTNPSEGVVRLTKSSYGGLERTGQLSGVGYVGGGTVAASETADRFCLASASGGTLSVSYIDLSGAEAFPAPVSISAVLPSDALVFSEESPAFVALSADGADLYLSGKLADGSAATYVWRDYAFAAAPVRLEGIGRRITGMLPDGRLYAANGAGMRIYEGDGAGRFDLSFKRILYAGERWDAAGGRWLSRFTRATTASVDSGEGREYRVEIWEYPTAELSGLAD